MALPFVQVETKRPPSPSAHRPRRCARRPTSGWSSLRTRRRRGRRRGRRWSWRFATRGMRSGADGRQIRSNIETRRHRGVECGGILWESGQEWRYMTGLIYNYKWYTKWISWENHPTNGKPMPIYYTTNQHVMIFACGKSILGPGRWWKMIDSDRPLNLEVADIQKASSFELVICQSFLSDDLLGIEFWREQHLRCYYEISWVNAEDMKWWSGEVVGGRNALFFMG